MARPLITVGMTAYNVEDSIVDTIKSIVAQTIDDWELIIVVTALLIWNAPKRFRELKDTTRFGSYKTSMTIITYQTWQIIMVI